MNSFINSNSAVARSQARQVPSYYMGPGCAYQRLQCAQGVGQGISAAPYAAGMVLRQYFHVCTSKASKLGTCSRRQAVPREPHRPCLQHTTITSSYKTSARPRTITCASSWQARRCSSPQKTVHTHIHTHTHTHTHSHTHANTQTYTYICICICIYMYILTGGWGEWW